MTSARLRHRFSFVCALLLFTSAPAKAAQTPQFTRHVEAVFSRLGCNAGTCHGPVKGQDGFRLSLFGADPALDHERLLREGSGRRLNSLDPESSLLLLKPTGRVSHQGGRRMVVGSVEYEIDIGGDVSLRVLARARADLTRGAQVWVGIDTRRAAVFGRP